MKKDPKSQLDTTAPGFWWLLQSAPDGIVIVDRKGHILVANEQMEQLFGYTEGELTGKTIELLVPDRYHKTHIRYRKEYVTAPRTRPMGVGMDLFGKRKDASEFSVEISLSPVRTRQGLLVMAIVRDVTLNKREHYISETLQKTLISPIPENIPGLQIASTYHSAYTGAQVGGDFFDVFALDDQFVCIVIGDVSGKGVDASIRTALAKYSLRAYAYEDPAPLSVMKRLNKTVYLQSESDTFITLFYGVLDIKNGIFTFANAGHMPPLHLGYKSKLSQLISQGIPLGVSLQMICEEHNIEFEEGDRMLFYTDGVTDARGSQGFYGMERLIKFFFTTGLETPKECIKHMMETLEEWSGEHLQDDVAILLVSRTPHGIV